jgi:hypothetical protein
MSALAHARRAVSAWAGGDPARAERHLARARAEARTARRRERQIVEIVALALAGNSQRAAGLALEHAVAFPDDAELLAPVSCGSAR